MTKKQYAKKFFEKKYINKEYPKHHLHVFVGQDVYTIVQDSVTDIDLLIQTLISVRDSAKDKEILL